jgi:hypothetical protein
MQHRRMPRATLACAAAALTLASPAVAVPTETLAQAEQVRADVQRRTAGFAITEAASTGVVHSLTLVEGGGSTPRVVSAANGIYYAICPWGARCPYPARGAASLRKREPRRIALELAVETFRTTAVEVVVVALPSRHPVLLVLQREDVRGHEGNGALDRVTLAHAYALRGLVNVSDTQETLVLARLSIAT